MKVKAKLDLDSIKNWLLEHGEKLALGIVAVVVLLFTYFAIQREVLDASKQPDNLLELAQAVNEHVTASRWDAQREGVQLVDYTERAKSKPVKLDSFALPTLLDPPSHDPKAKRDDPEVLGVEDLRVGSGYDVFAMKADAAARDEGEDTQLQAQPWAVVTGLVPVERQKQAYARAFGQAVGAEGSDSRGGEGVTPHAPAHVRHRPLPRDEEPTAGAEGARACQRCHDPDLHAHR